MSSAAAWCQRKGVDTYSDRVGGVHDWAVTGAVLLYPPPQSASSLLRAMIIFGSLARFLEPSMDPAPDSETSCH